MDCFTFRKKRLINNYNYNYSIHHQIEKVVKYFSNVKTETKAHSDHNTATGNCFDYI